MWCLPQVTKAVLLALVQGETDSHEVIKAMLEFSVSLDAQQDVSTVLCYEFYLLYVQTQTCYANFDIALQGLGLLHWACMKGHTKSVEVLLDSGIDINPHTKVSFLWAKPVQ